MSTAHLEIVRQLCSPSVPGIHGDKYSAIWVALDHVAHEHEGPLLRGQSVQDGEHLYRLGVFVVLYRDSTGTC